jgi:tetratricopeptide (TPR) repeat protein
MKKNKVYIAAIVMFLFASCFIFWRYEVRVQKKQRTQFGLLERKGNLANIAEWASIKTSAAAMLKKITENPSDKKSLLTLTAIYLQEARISGNYAYYDAAAIKLVNNILKIDPENFEALTFKAMIQMSQHHFAEGLAIAEKAKQINPYNAFVYGLLVDGNVEMGNYDAAVKDCDKMISIRPDIRSYSRVSYLREIYGDLQGAIEAMKMAVDAGPPGDENTEWSRVQLGKLYESTGNADSAEYEYQISLQLRPGYAFALAGLGRVHAHKNDFRHAVDAYKQAVAFVDDFGIKEELAELYESMGKKDSATILFQQNIDQWRRRQKLLPKYDSVGHYADREMAYAWLKNKQL